MAILSKSAALAALAILTPAIGFAPPPTQLSHLTHSSQSSAQIFMSPEITETLSTLSSSIDLSTPELSSTLLSFSDQGQNLAGIFFQASLLPYLTFLYFLGFRGNRAPDLGKFGFAYLLLFVLGTIPSGIVTKSFYGETLANVDWLHGGAEALLTVTNVLIVSSFCLWFMFFFLLWLFLSPDQTNRQQVLGFREAMTNPSYQTEGSKFGITPKLVGGAFAATFAAACAFGTNLGLEVHTPFLGGAGNLGEETMLALPFGKLYDDFRQYTMIDSYEG